MSVFKVPSDYVLEANDALLRRLEDALYRKDWDCVEATAGALHDLARTFTKPNGANT